MGAWTELTLARVEAEFPTDMDRLYRSWVEANPSKATRLTGIIDNVVSAFREAVAAPGGAVMDEDLSMIPSTGYRHAMNQVLFTLGMEMGLEFSPESYSLVTQSHVWLRMVQSGYMPAVAAESGATPSYVGRVRCER